jgi:hypothetical protein
MSSVIVVLSRKVGFDKQTLTESTDDHRASHLHYVQRRHPPLRKVVHSRRRLLYFMAESKSPLRLMPGVRAILAQDVDPRHRE